MEQESFVWVFSGAGGRFPSAVFSSREAADAWIASHRLTGVLTAYPLDMGVFDWALESGFFTPKRDEQRSPEYIQRFSSARQPHVHYENGKAVAG